MESTQLHRTPTSNASAPRKSVLCCSTCGHRAPIDGDWVVTEHSGSDGRRRAYGCPACGRTLVVQPVFEASTPG